MSRYPYNSYKQRGADPEEISTGRNYRSKSRVDDRDDYHHRPKSPYSSSSTKSMESPEKTFHITMHQALLVWKKEMEEEHERDMQKLRRKFAENLDAVEQDKVRTIQVVEMEKDRAIERVHRQAEKDRLELEALKKEVAMLKQGWSKEKEQWALTKKSLAKDLDPSAFDFLGCT